MPWVSFWINDEGKDSDAIVISTYDKDKGDAGGWARKLETIYTYPYICEKNEWIKFIPILFDKFTVLSFGIIVAVKKQKGSVKALWQIRNTTM